MKHFELIPSRECGLGKQGWPPHVKAALLHMIYSDTSMHTPINPSSTSALPSLNENPCDPPGLHQRVEFFEVRYSGWQDETISLSLAEKSEASAKRQSLSDIGRLPDHIKCHILSMVSGISVEGAGADGQGRCALSVIGRDGYSRSTSL